MPGPRGPVNFRQLAIWAGPAAAVAVVLLTDLVPGERQVTWAAAVTVWMVIWWLTEALPMAITALLPVVAFPALKILPGAEVAGLYFNSVIFLFLGGFIVALALQRWNLHRRLALLVISATGSSPARLLLGFMLASALLSMWISNTATTMMMVPIALGAIQRLEKANGGSLALAGPLLLGIAYGASIGGIATLIGTPANLVFMRTYALTFPEAAEISFTAWLIMALPVSALLFIFGWGGLALWIKRLDTGSLRGQENHFAEELASLGPMSREERLVLVHFIVLALLWLTRGDINLGETVVRGWGSRLGLSGYVDDGTVAVAVAMLLFIIPARGTESGRLMDWNTAKQLPWHIILLFGGGFALARGFTTSGLSGWVGSQLGGLATLPTLLMVLSVCLVITFLTEITSNTATVQVMLPILAAVALETGLHPLTLMVPATLSASCAFMMPIATPPNAIVYGTDRIAIRDMVRIGLVLNLIGAAIITVAVFGWGGALAGLQ